MQESPHYPGGLALRFARVKGYRQDKSANDADTIDAVRDIYLRSLGEGAVTSISGLHVGLPAGGPRSGFARPGGRAFPARAGGGAGGSGGWLMCSPEES